MGSDSIRRDDARARPVSRLPSERPRPGTSSAVRDRCAPRTSGCRASVHASPANRAPFRIAFETAGGERLGTVAYAFLANTKVTKNRPGDEHRFQLKYGAKDRELHEIWQDPYGLYTTLLLGINPEEGFFVGADPVVHNPTKMFISIEFKQREVDEILSTGWTAWERDRRSDGDPIEVLVGGKPQSFLDYIRFEREACGEDQGHRQALAESPHERHDLASELGFSEQEVMDLIQSTPMTKMAVRGAAAEEHLARALGRVRGVSDCARGRKGEADVLLRFHGVPLSIECKNVLRRRNKDNLARVDFQRTRSSKTDKCSAVLQPGRLQRRRLPPCRYRTSGSSDSRSRRAKPPTRCALGSSTTTFPLTNGGRPTHTGFSRRLWGSQVSLVDAIRVFSMGKPTVISLYSGAGGLDYGFEAAGFRTSVALEIDHDSCETLRREPEVARHRGDSFRRPSRTRTPRDCQEAREGRSGRLDRWDHRASRSPNLGTGPRVTLDALRTPGRDVGGFHASARRCAAMNIRSGERRRAWRTPRRTRVCNCSSSGFRTSIAEREPTINRRIVF